MSDDDLSSAHQWLAQVAALLDLPEDVQKSSVKPILDLTREVAHNRSRPAAPVTAFLVGLAAGRDSVLNPDATAEDPEALRAAIARHLNTISAAAQDKE